MLIVSEETSLGMPALICAWREGICPWPACSTWPITTCSTCSGSTPDALERRLDRDAAELGGVERGQAAAHLADGGAGGAEDHGLGHWLRTLLGSGEKRIVTRPADCSVHGRAQSSPSRGAGYCALIVNVSWTPTQPEATDADTVVVGLFEGEEPRAGAAGAPRSGRAARQRRGAALVQGARAGPRRGQALAARRARRAQGLHARARARRGRASPVSGRARSPTRVLCWEVPAARQGAGDASAAVAGALVEGTILADYRFELHKSAAGDGRGRGRQAQAPRRA